MAFCKNCGTEMEDDARFCVACGTPVAATTGKGSPPVNEPESDGFKTQVRQKPVYGVVNLENLPEGHVVDERYEVKEKIGQGGFGAVYRVFDRKMEIEKALKVLPEAIINDREAMESLRKEATTMARLNHPNIVRVYDFQEQGPIKYIDMEYVDGKNLTDIKLDAPGKKLTEEYAKKIGMQIAKGLAYAHSEKVIHRDIKPQNILLSEKNGVKIMDFGISETVRSSMSRMANSGSSGTLVYMSPEQLKGKDVGREADIYSFGALLYELVSGKPPFHKGDIAYQILNETPEKVIGISGRFNTLMQRCLAKEYADRYRSFEEVQKALERKQPEPVVEKPKPVEAPKAAPPPEPSPSSTPPPSKPAGSKLPMLGLGVPIALIVGVLVVMYLVLNSGGSKPGKSNTPKPAAENHASVEEGRLTVTTDPSYAGIRVLNVTKEYSDGMSLSPGRYRVKVTAYGYKDKIEWVDITAGVNRKVNVVLEKAVEDARLTVRTTPENARVRILNIKPVYEDGIRLAPGKYHISVSAPGYETKNQWVELKPGMNGVVDVELEKVVVKAPPSRKPENRLTNSLGMEFVYIKPGSFMMGSPSSESGRYDDERQHRVTLTKGYYMQTTEVTQGQWRRVMGSNPSKFSSCGDDCPVEKVSWNDVQEFIRKLNAKEGSNKYRLPTEAEWEYACRAGSDTPYANGNSLDVMGWYYKNSGSKTHPVARKKANAWGLYDMHGNVYEWCQDRYGKSYPSGTVTDPQGPSSGSNRVLRGGCWGIFAHYCRSAHRDGLSPGSRSSHLGFRLVLSSGQQG